MPISGTSTPLFITTVDFLDIQIFILVSRFDLAAFLDHGNDIQIFFLF